MGSCLSTKNLLFSVSDVSFLAHSFPLWHHRKSFFSEVPHDQCPQVSFLRLSDNSFMVYRFHSFQAFPDGYDAPADDSRIHDRGGVWSSLWFSPSRRCGESSTPSGALTRPEPLSPVLLLQYTTSFSFRDTASSQPRSPSPSTIHGPSFWPLCSAWPTENLFPRGRFSGCLQRGQGRLSSRPAEGI